MSEPKTMLPTSLIQLNYPSTKHRDYSIRFPCQMRMSQTLIYFLPTTSLFASPLLYKNLFPLLPLWRQNNVEQKFDINLIFFLCIIKLLLSTDQITRHSDAQSFGKDSYHECFYDHNVLVFYSH